MFSGVHPIVRQIWEGCSQSEVDNMLNITHRRELVWELIREYVTEFLKYGQCVLWGILMNTGFNLSGHQGKHGSPFCDQSFSHFWAYYVQTLPFAFFTLLPLSDMPWLQGVKLNFLSLECEGTRVFLSIDCDI